MKEKFNKLAIIAMSVAIVLMVIALIANGFIAKKQTEEFSEVSIYVEDVYNKIYDTLNEDENNLKLPVMVKLTDEEFQDLYSIDAEKVNSYVIYKAFINIRATEIGVIEVKSEDDIENVKECLKIRAENIANEYKEYLEDQYNIAKKPLILVKGRYVIFSITENNDEVEDIFKSFFN